MTTPAQFSRKPGKLHTPPLRPHLPATTDGISTTDYADYADYTDFSDQRVSPLCFPLAACLPKSVTSVKSVVETPPFVSMGACRAVVRRRPVHSWFPQDFIAPSSRQIAPRGQGRGGAITPANAPRSTPPPPPVAHGRLWSPTDGKLFPRARAPDPSLLDQLPIRRQKPTLP